MKKNKKGGEYDAKQRVRKQRSMLRYLLVEDGMGTAALHRLLGLEPGTGATRNWMKGVPMSDENFAKLKALHRTVKAGFAGDLLANAFPAPVAPPVAVTYAPYRSAKAAAAQHAMVEALISSGMTEEELNVLLGYHSANGLNSFRKHSGQCVQSFRVATLTALHAGLSPAPKCCPTCGQPLPAEASV